ncbi:hypothetical protein SK128_008080 [Halocaridina rubra]|uniref:Uncharacterized protein n=1 Tax=Halocaridina rubra TaxID=373956 RepID=A0AAN9A8S5_HALRR
MDSIGLVLHLRIIHAKSICQIKEKGPQMKNDYGFGVALNDPEFSEAAGTQAVQKVRESILALRKVRGEMKTVPLDLSYDQQRPNSEMGDISFPTEEV